MPRVIGAELPAENMMQGYSSGENIRLSRERLKLQQMEAASNASAQRRQIQLQEQRTRVEAYRLRQQAEENARQAAVAAEEIRAKTQLAEETARARAANEERKFREGVRQFDVTEARLRDKMAQEADLAQTKQDRADLELYLRHKESEAKRSQAERQYQETRADKKAQQERLYPLTKANVESQIQSRELRNQIALGDAYSRGTVMNSKGEFVARPGYVPAREKEAAVKRAQNAVRQTYALVREIGDLMADEEAAQSVIAQQGANLTPSELTKYTQLRTSTSGKLRNRFQVLRAKVSELLASGIPQETVSLIIGPVIMQSVPDLMGKEQTQPGPQAAPTPAPSALVEAQGMNAAVGGPTVPDDGDRAATDAEIDALLAPLP